LAQEWSVCEGCQDALTDDIEYYRWEDRYTEEIHERAVERLAGYDEIECVISSYDAGQIIVHTPYVSSNVVTDFCDFYGFEIVAFNPIWFEQDDWPCLDSHGSIFQIVLEYNQRSPMPSSESLKFFENDLEQLDGNDKQFG
jgi:hypothetical protein